jgi:hypothetical protein
MENSGSSIILRRPGTDFLTESLRNAQIQWSGRPCSPRMIVEDTQYKSQMSTVPDDRHQSQYDIVW